MSKIFVYIYIPESVDGPIQEKVLEVRENSEIEDFMGELAKHFERAHPFEKGHVEKQMKQLKNQMGSTMPDTVSGEYLKNVMSQQMVETVMLKGPRPSNGFVGVNMYVDDAAGAKGLGRNARASDIATCCGLRIDVLGDAFLSLVMDNGDEFERLDLTLSEVSSNAAWIKEAKEQNVERAKHGSNGSHISRNMMDRLSDRKKDVDGACISNSADDAEQLKVQGNGKYEQKQYGQAVDLYTQALEIDDAFLVARNNRSMALIKLCRWREALDDANLVLKQEPRNPKACMRAATAMVGLGNRDEGIGLLEIFIKNNPGNGAVEQCLRGLSAE
eukprot:jgi/Picsp_1/5860/NSC_03219-R1_protein